MIIEGIVHFSEAADWKRIASGSSGECVGWAGAGIEIVIPDSTIGTDNLRRNASLVNQNFVSRAVARFGSFVPFLARNTDVGDTVNTVPDGVQWAFAGP